MAIATICDVQAINKMKGTCFGAESLVILEQNAGGPIKCKIYMISTRYNRIKYMSYYLQ